MFLHGNRRGATSSPDSSGIITFSGWWYDLLVRWFVTRGKESQFRTMIADLAQIQPGEAVLDVGCGTGTQALVAKKRVGEMGRVSGIDPSKSLLAAARRKAERAGLHIDFLAAGIEQIPAPSQSFDVVLSTFMMHHLPDPLKRQGLAEIVRILTPGGRLLIIDFKHPEEHQDTSEQSGARAIDIQGIPALLEKAGFSQIETGEIPFRIRSISASHTHYGFVRARKSLT